MQKKILDAALGIPNGHRTRIVCPFCLDKEVTMVVQRTDTGVIRYLCYRAKCGKRGNYGSKGGTGIAEARITQPRPFSGAYTELPEHVKEFLYNKYHIKDISTWKWTDNNRVLIPLREVSGERWGWVARGFSAFGFTGPKTINYYDKEIIFYSV